MLERFRVPAEDEVRISEEALRETVATIFTKLGLSDEDSAEGADVLVTADLRGVETHGVSNMLRAYVERYMAGEHNPTATIRIERETPGTAVVDGDNALGIVVGRQVMNIAIEKARTVGVGVVTMHNNGHLGAIGHFAMIAAQADMLGMCASAGGAGVLPTFGAEPRFGTNPFSYAAPARNEAPVLFDVATSAVAGNKIRLAKRVGAKLEPGWLANTDGTPIMEEIDFPDWGEFHGLPLGGTREQGSHKGYGFQLMVELLSSGLSSKLISMLDPQGGGKSHFAAYNIAAFTDVDEFKDKMDSALKMLRETKPAPGHERVLYPGLSEHEHELDRRANGIPLHREVIEWFDHIAGELSIPPIRRL